MYRTSLSSILSWIYSIRWQARNSGITKIQPTFIAECRLYFFKGEEDEKYDNFIEFPVISAGKQKFFQLRHSIHYKVRACVLKFMLRRVAVAHAYSFYACYMRARYVVLGVPY